MFKRTAKTIITSLILALIMVVPASAATAKITLNKQGGSGGTGSVTATYGKAMPAVTKPSKAGYTFGGYFTKTAGAGTKYYTAAGKSAKNSTFKKATTLYAKWTANSKTVTFNANGGTGSSKQTFTAGKGQKFGATGITRFGYTLQGWSTASGASNKVNYSTFTGVSDSWIGTGGSVTLYAVWARGRYTVTLNRLGSTIGTSAITCTYAEEMPDIDPPVKTGYTFKGYYDAQSGGTIYYDEDGCPVRLFNKGANTTLYARWLANKYDVDLDEQDADASGTTALTATFGSVLPTIRCPEKEGHIFCGYSDEKLAGNFYIDSTGKGVKAWDKAEEATLYAQWDVTKHNVKFDKWGGTGGTAPTIKIAFGGRLPVVTPPMKANYTFSGYYTLPDGDGEQYYDEKGKPTQNWAETSDTTLYAFWEDAGCDDAHSFTISLLKKATPQADGSITRVCTECKWKITSVINRIASVSTKANAYAFTGEAVTPAIVAKDSKGKVISSNYYNVSYSNNKAIGTAKANIYFKGLYSGSMSTTFRIVKNKALGGTKITKLTPGKKSFIARWKKQTKNANGYELQYSTSKKFKKGVQKVVLSGAKRYNGFKLTKLRAKKRYYVRVRTYRTVKGIDFFSKWSKVKSVRTR